MDQEARLFQARLQLVPYRTTGSRQAPTFSCISCVDCASQNATVATSLRMGISTEQSRPSRRAMSGRGCIGPLGMGPRGPDTGNDKLNLK